MRTLLFVGLVWVLVGCGPAELAEDFGSAQQGLAVPSEDRPQSVDVGSWNVEWYGDATNGPTDEARQQANVERVMAQLDLDLVGMVEVVSPAGFANVVAKMPDHDGLLVTDARVEGGAAFYSASEQKVGLVFRRRFRVDAARVILTEDAQVFAGRPPLELKLSWSEGGRARSLVVIVAHFKAMANADGWQRRSAAAAALKGYLDATYPARWVLVVGDWNDDLDTSTYRGHASPFAALAADSRYRFTTDALTAASIATTVGFSSTIDHHLATDELAARFVAGSAKVVRLEQYVSSYGTTTSDHYPVVTRYDLR
ncbi:MAG: endonuclease [Archangiaceae bacterium]|nr:endonuclease [Archangiaceae bacterium]